MSALPLVAGTFVLVGIVGGLLNHFGNRTQHAWYVSLVAFISWFFPFSIVVLLPLDLSSTLYEGCPEAEECNKPFLYVSGEFLLVAWRAMYWCSFVLTWALIPLLQAYTQSGEFTVMKRFRSAVRHNIIYQLIVGSVALIGLVFLIHNQGTSNLRAYIMALSNSWGLILVVIFMGYGMVDVPRRLWHKGDTARELRRIAFKASVVKDKCQDTEDEVLNVAKELSIVCHRVQLSDPLRQYVDKMVEGFPAARGVQFELRTSSPIPPSQSNRNSTSGTLGVSSRTAPASGIAGRKHAMDAAVPANISEKYLADLNARIKWAIRMNDRWTAIWHDLLKAGFLAQDIQDNADNPEKKFRSSLRPLSSKPKEWQLSFKWHWHLKIRPFLLRNAAVICAILSLLIVWSEVTYNHTNPVLSVISLLVQLAQDRVSYGAIEAISFLTMLYMCTCAYTTLMKMKLLNNYVLVPNHHTDEPTLLFIGSYLCRLTFPLVYNYLTVSTTIGKEDTTIFAGYMGKIDMVPFLGDLNYYMPYVILVPTLVTLFNVFAKMFAVCSISDNFFDNDDEDGGIGGDLEEGLQVLKDARRDEERRLMPERTGLNRDFAARRGAAFDNYNINKNRNRGDTSSRSMLGEGSSASAWRDVRPHPSRPYQEPYFDDFSDEDDNGSVFGNRNSIDNFGAPGGGANVGGTSGIARGSFDSSSRPGSSRDYRSVASPRDTNQGAGPFKSLWQKLVQKKPAISLSETTGENSGLDSDGARSSLESNTGNDSNAVGGRNRNSSASVLSGPALMFASVQPSGFGRPLQPDHDDRENLLSPRDARIPSPSSSRAQSPQGRAFGQGHSYNSNTGRNSRPNSRVFGTSQGSTGGRGYDPSRPTSTGNRHASPLVNIFDEDDG
ncbi:hypothetical protein MVEG_03672 [Podila verticillata NRRL 6337]|nr:hypothetical protein MVEG_03672 [Podila verticillata NRRL 6337]